MKIGYARVSTKDQAVDLQVDALKQAGCVKVYSEVISGARAHRPVLEGLLETLRPGDVLVIWKLDRLGRSLPHLIGIINDLTARKVGLKSLNDPLDTTTSHGRLILNLFASLSEFERDLLRERTQAGLSAARSGAQGRPAQGPATSRAIHGLRHGDLVPARSTQCPADRRETADFQEYPLCLPAPSRGGHRHLSRTRGAASRLPVDGGSHDQETNLRGGAHRFTSTLERVSTPEPRSALCDAGSRQALRRVGTNPLPCVARADPTQALAAHRSRRAADPAAGADGTLL